MRIKTSNEVGEFLESVWSRLHVTNKAVLGRAGLFLALGEGVPSGFKSIDSHGIELAEETILGDDLIPVVRAALNYRAGATLASSLDEACGIRGFVAPNIPYSATLHTGYAIFGFFPSATNTLYCFLASCLRSEKKADMFMLLCFIS